MIDAMKYLGEEYELHLMLVANGKAKLYLTALRKRAGNDRRIHFHEPVPITHICEKIHQFDLGVFLLPPNGLNYWHALPNKLFEFVQARLGIVVSPNPDMAALVTRHELGRIADDFTAKGFAHTVGDITPRRIHAFKANADKAAPLLSAEHEAERLRGLVDGIIG
jgi:hypothetical protein